jgi:hypothetical protein
LDTLEHPAINRIRMKLPTFTKIKEGKLGVDVKRST